jgi:RNA polymerase sigma-70 factor (ECF subfamily)
VNPASREERFVALAELVGESLLRFAVRRTDPETAQDVVAEALLVLWRRLDDVPTDDPMPWCYAVARRCLANAERSVRRHLRLVDRIARMQQPQVVDLPSPVDVELDAALNRLTRADRDLLRLWAWEELAPREIAVVLGISANAVSIRLHRARARLAALLEAQRETQERPHAPPDRNR